MTYEEIVQEVYDGAKFIVNFQKQTFRLNGKPVDLTNVSVPFNKTPVLKNIECRYNNYKYSIPSERSESHRRNYFKALPYSQLSDNDMMYGENREVARCRLELLVLLCIMQGMLTWKDEWGSWFWQSPNDKDLIILRDWVEPNKGGA